MSARYRIEGYAIVSSDGMIADESSTFPDALKSEADQRFCEHEFDRFDVVVHGRRSYEGQANSPNRRRLILTRKVAAFAPDPDRTKSLLWNPAGASFDEVCGALGVSAGTVAILGGTDVYDLFLDIGYDAFHLCRAGTAKLPSGVPIFSQVRVGRSPEDVLAQRGLEPTRTRVLDDARAVSVVHWTRKTQH
jgi:dihydrofolate reductase